LVLRGQARSHYAKQLALHAVTEVVNLPIEANEIKVDRERRDGKPDSGETASLVTSFQ
jgi:hypothetical protein